ncbi:response regulator [Maridesulfovibrio sp. FT414]|uniref:hybrid sensor histidine kinase/response regulator n=1 Tax=Maridesulfovibrio sp. FT414 TaxID=2979469 RepID=UPI003D8038B4
MDKIRNWSGISMRSFIVTTVMLTFLSAFGFYAMFQQETESIINVIKINSRMNNRLLSQKVSLDLRNIFYDIQIACSYLEVHKFLASRAPADRIDVEYEFSALCETRKVYDQIRILGNDGMELVRVNYVDGKAVVVPPDELQYKGDRYYFRETLDLEPSGVYVSDFDLNIENGKIEVPHKPMIRISKGIYDKSGERIGVIVLNYLGGQIVDTVAKSGYINNKYFMNSMLLNSKGYWLVSPDRKFEWAFMFPEQKEHSFANYNPEEWKKISSSPIGQFASPDGIYTYSTIVVSPEVVVKDTDGDFRKWKIVCLTTTETIDFILKKTVFRYSLAYCGVILLILFGALTRAKFVSVRNYGQQKLELAKKDAEAANIAKSEFLARMSHEIRTPMNAIIGLTYLALKIEMTPKLRDYLTKVEASAKALLGIINDILDFSKIEADRFELEMADFQLDDVFNDVLNLFGYQAEQSGIELLLMVKSNVPNLLIGDRLRLGQIIINLVGNAIKFTKSGEVVLTAELIEEKPESVVIQFFVQDTGIGISREHLSKLFQPFSQADGSISRQFGGTGLGLAISKSLVELMGGEMTVESEPGKGSTFSFAIPFKLQSIQYSNHYMYPDCMRGMRVLVVDDSRMFREITAKVLKSFSFDVHTAAHGAQALELLQDNDSSDPFRLVITDWRMPDIDGITLLRKIKRNSALENIPKVIMLTAYGRNEIRSRAEKDELDGFLLKPFNRSILFDTIMEVFAHGNLSVRNIGFDKKRKGVPLNVAGAKVLLAEDNEINQQVAREILESAHIEVTIANNGQEALELVRTSNFDAILMDIQMPMMDGLQTTKIMRSDEKLADIPIIAMTAHALVGDKEKSLLAGMNDHITKPIDPDQLMEVLSKWLPDKVSCKDCPTDLSQLPDSYQKLVGLNARAGLARVRGNCALYEKLLINFALSCDLDFDKMRTSIAEEDYVSAVQVAHTLKGVCGNIGADALHVGMQELELMLRNESSESLARLDSLEADWKIVAEGILNAFPPVAEDESDGSDEGRSEPFDPAMIVELRGQLELIVELLEQHDVMAREEFRKIEGSLSSFNSMLSVELRSMLDRFDFAKGREIVERLIVELNGKDNGHG